MRGWTFSILLLSLCAAPASAERDEEYFTVLGHEVAKFAATQAKVDALRALAIANESAPEATFVMVELVMDGPATIYEILFVAPNGPSEIELDAATGKVIPVEEESATDEERAAGLHQREALLNAKIDLRRAITLAAERVKGGTVIRAGAAWQLDAAFPKVKYEVELLSDGAFQLVTLDANGTITDVAPSKDEPGGRAWTFDRDIGGKRPSGWTPGYTNPEQGKALWTAASDAQAMTGPRCLKLVAESGTRVYNVAMADGTSYGDVDVRARVRADRGKVDQGGGVIWRCQDAKNYYICRYNPLEANFRVYHVIDGHRTQLQSVDVATQPGRWYSVRAKMIGDHILCFLDGKKLLDVRDNAIPTPGMVGLWTKADASTSFDNVAVRNATPFRTDSDPVARPSAASDAHSHDDDD